MSLLPPNFDAEGFNELLLQLWQSEVCTPYMIQAAREYASAMSKCIFVNYDFLNVFVTRYEALMRKRWLKKTASQRREILLKAWPTMAHEHGIGITFRLNWLLHQKGLAPQPHDMDGFAWPYINVEDLTKPKSLLIFINSRGRNPPWTFASSETEFSPQAILKAKHPACMAAATMRFGPETDHDAYGEIREDASCCIKSEGDHIHADVLEGLQILRAQVLIMRFLTRCCMYICHDLGIRKVLDAPETDEPPTSDLQIHVDDGSSAFSEALVVAPYLKRGEIDLRRLQGYVDAMYDEIKDHVFMLRQDPSYMADTIAAVSEHRPEMIPHDDDKKAFNDIRFQGDVLTTLVSDAYRGLLMWHWISTKLDLLVAHTCERGVVQETLQAILNLEAILIRAMRQLLDTLGTAGMASPPLRKHFFRTSRCIPMNGNNKTMKMAMNFASRPGLLVGAQGFMFHLFRYLLNLHEYNIREKTSVLKNEKVPTNNLYHGIDLYTLLDYMDTLARKDKTARDMLSAPLWSLFSQLSIVVECHKQLMIWKKSPIISTTLQRTDVRAGTLSQEDTSTTWARRIIDHSLPYALVDPARGKLDYPRNETRTAQTVTIMRRSEANLDRFWEFVDAFFSRTTGIAQHDVLRTCLSEAGDMIRTPPWVSTLETKVNDLHVYQPLPASHDVSQQFTGQFDRLALQHRVKTKTKGQTHTKPNISDNVDDELEPTSAEPVEHVIKVDKRAHKVFKAMFGAPASEKGEIPKIIKWDEFKRAMVRAGFAMEELQGSARHFKPLDKMIGVRGIQVHEPHPENEILYPTLKIIGTRLEKAYGWSANTFKLA